MKAKYRVAILLLVCVALACICYFANQHAIDKAYNNAVILIEKCSYEEALSELEKANSNVLDRDDFYTNVSNNRIEECYKNSITLYAYALAQLEYNSDNRYMETVNDYLKIVPQNYSGELSEEIKTFKGNFKPQYDEFLKEEEIRLEKIYAEIRKGQDEFYAELKTKIPYEGMRESDISRTIMGKYHEMDYDPEYGFTKYYWKTNSGDIMLIVTCRDDEVSSVSRYGWGYFWTDDIKPIWNGVSPYRKSARKTTPTEPPDDPYNVYDYSNEEDFYYDNYDDFWDYEEAADYFNEHNG